MKEPITVHRDFMVALYACLPSESPVHDFWLVWGRLEYEDFNDAEYEWTHGRGYET